MEYLFAMWDGGGTVGPELVLVRRLVARGHRVTALAAPTLRTQVEAAGATFLPWQRVPHRRMAADPDPFVDHDLRTPMQVADRLLDRVLAGPAADYAAEVGAALDARPADAVLATFTLLGALAAAESRGLPSVALMPNVYLLPARGLPPYGTGWFPLRGPLGRLRDSVMNAVFLRLWSPGTATLNAARHELGLPPLRHVFDQLTGATRVLVLTSRAFEFPARMPANVRYVGPQLDDPAWALPAELPPGDEPLVLVSMSSTFMDQAPVLRRAVAALDTLPVRTLVTTGPEIDPAEVPGTERVRVVRSAPHSTVLPHAAACVTHGGHGSVAKALVAGVPQLVIPLGRDQPDSAARVVAAGAGLRLGRKAPPGAIARAVRRLLDEPSFRIRAAELGAVMRADEASGTAIDELEAVALDRNGVTP
ncbi:MAG: glycosyltransferase [Streptosporangiales bacterium]|nr:glycosyltransferase [Streptosporangiales bacterium]